MERQDTSRQQDCQFGTVDGKPFFKACLSAMKTRAAILILATFVIGLVLSKSAPAQTGQRASVWDGVYTSAQAERGLPLMGQCRGCHGATMDGSQAPALRGEKFVDYWREDTLDSMYLLIKNSMPPRANSALTEEQAVSIVSYLLQESGYPAGNSELTVDAMTGIMVSGPNGPQPLPNYAAIQIVGCTTKGEGDNWLLTQTTEPIRARSAGRASDIELKTAAARGLGTRTYLLQNLAMAGITSASLQEGRKVFAKGALILNPAGDRLGVNTLQEVAATCGNE